MAEHQVIVVPFKVDSHFLGPEEAPGQHKGMASGQPANPGCSWLHAVRRSVTAQWQHALFAMLWRILCQSPPWLLVTCCS